MYPVTLLSAVLSMLHSQPQLRATISAEIEWALKTSALLVLLPSEVMPVFALELSDCEARCLLSLLEQTQDLPVGLSGVKERLSTLSESSTCSTEPPPSLALPVTDGPMDVDEQTQGDIEELQGECTCIASHIMLNTVLHCRALFRS